MRVLRVLKPALPVLAMTLAACSGAMQAPAAPRPPAQAGPTATEEMEALFKARQDSARMRFTAADVQFVSGMIGHHAQALVMSNLAPERAATPSIRTLAARIINAQNDEIALMQAWLKDRNQPVPHVQIEGINLTVHGAEHAHHMPGMLTPEQLQELEAAKGAEFDRLYLKYMIQHHQGAVTMVQELFAKDGTGQDEAVFKLASDIQVDQITEIERMKLMLAAMSAGDTR